MKYIFTLVFLLTAQQGFSAEGKSSAFRQAQWGGINLNVLGFVGPFITSGVNAHFNLTSKIMLEASTYNGTYSSSDWKMKLDYKVARVKYFLGNSFYTSLGYAQRDIKPLTRKESISIITTGTDDSNLPYATKYQGPEFVVGNQWQNGLFTIGCEWGGQFYGTEQEQTITKTDYGTDGFHTDESQSYKNSYDKWAHQKTMSIYLRFIMGFAF